MLSFECFYKSAILHILLSVVVASDGTKTLDYQAPFTEMAEAYRHPAEEHWVITEDGYNITIFRLPGDKARPVFLVHGYTANADNFIVRGNISLAITLADKGYDVWVISLRGTRYSYKHTDPAVEKDPRRYFNFTVYEKGIYDVPAAIDFILEKTEQKQLTAIGYSMGTTVFYVLGAEKPEYNRKISVMISLGPVCYYKNVQGLTKISTDLQVHTRAELSEVKGPPSSELSSRFNHIMCGKIGTLLPHLAYVICVKGFIFPCCGEDEEGFEPQFTPMFFGHTDVTVAKTDLHTLQTYKSDKFAKFDYGVHGNEVMYNSTEPPEFDLSKVTMKVALLVGKNDYIATVKDAERLRDLLPNVVHYEILQYEKFNHQDFTFGRHMPSTLYPSVLPLVEKYTV